MCANSYRFSTFDVSEVREFGEALNLHVEKLAAFAKNHALKEFQGADLKKWTDKATTVGALQAKDAMQLQADQYIMLRSWLVGQVSKVKDYNEKDIPTILSHVSSAPKLIVLGAAFVTLATATLW